MCGYSKWVGERAISDVVKTCKFVPSVAEVNEACERYAPAKETSTWVDHWELRSQLQLEERARLEAPVDESERERIIAGFDELLRHLRRDDEKEAEFTPEAIKAKFGLTDAQWDAIPNAPADSTWAKSQRAAE